MMHTVHCHVCEEKAFEYSDHGIFVAYCNFVVVCEKCNKKIVGVDET